MKIGFIGLGNMGGPMALNLIKAGHDPRGPRRAPRGGGAAPRARRHAGRRARAPRPAERELILTSLPGPAEVEAVALGADGIIHGRGAGQRSTPISPRARPR